MALALNSTSTLAAVTAAYDDNVDYDLSDSVVKCKDFIQACRILLRRQADESQHGDSSVRDEYRKIEARLEQAEAWWATNDSSAATRFAGSVKYPSFEGFRGT